jgi:hypothetical protein
MAFESLSPVAGAGSRENGAILEWTKAASVGGLVTHHADVVTDQRALH